MKLRPHDFLFPAAAALLSATSFAQRELTVGRPAIDADVPTHFVGAPKSAAAAPLAAETRASAEPSYESSVASRVESRELLEHVMYDLAADGTVWALGDAYKASFDAGGFTYIPYLGARAPRNFPVEFALERATIGGVDIAFDAAAAPMRAADRVVYERGTLREVYDLTTTSVEQSFVFDTLPARGEIALRMNITSSMQRGEHAQRLSFANEHGRVDYSRAVAIDAAGTRTELSTRFDGDDIEIRVPAEVAARAVLPLVVDPVLTSYVVDVTTEETIVPEAAYDATSDVTATIWERAFSATDHDVAIKARDAAGTVVQFVYIDLSAEHWRNPRVANNNASGKFLVVATMLPQASSPRILARTIALVGPVMSPKFEISVGVSGAQTLPDVGGDYDTGSTSSFCVVWQRERNPTDSDILARVLDADGGFRTNVLFIANDTDVLQNHPAISKGTGDASSSFRCWNIAYEQEFTANDHDIYGVRLTFAGTLPEPRFQIDYSGNDDRWPSVSSVLPGIGESHVYMAAFQRVVGFENRDIVASVLDGGTLLATANLSSNEGFEPANQIAATVDCDGSQFVVGYTESSPATGGYMRALASQYAYADGALWPSEVHVALNGSPQAQDWPRLVARRSSGGTDNCVAFAWQQTFNGEKDILGATYCGRVGGTVTTTCSGDGSGTACPCGPGGVGRGCPNSVFPFGATFTTSGVASVTNDDLVLRGASMPNSSCLYFQGTTAGSSLPFGDGLRCTGGSVIRLGTKSNANFESSYPSGADAPVSVRGALTGAGGVRYYQAWYRNAAVFCTTSTFNLTNGVRVVWTH